MDSWIWCQPFANVTTTQTTTFEDTIRDTFIVDQQSRNGTRKVVTEQFDNESLGDRVVSRDVIMICVLEI